MWENKLQYINTLKSTKLYYVKTARTEVTPQYPINIPILHENLD